MAKRIHDIGVSRMLGSTRPASMLMVVAALPRPQFLFEIEVIAAV